MDAKAGISVWPGNQPAATEHSHGGNISPMNIGSTPYMAFTEFVNSVDMYKRRKITCRFEGKGEPTTNTRMRASMSSSLECGLRGKAH